MKRNGIEKNFSLKKYLKKMALLLTMAGITVAAVNVQAAESSIPKTRGYVNVDLRNFMLVNSTIDGSDDYALKARNSDKTEYELYAYQDVFGSRDGNGVTYRSGANYDMTDVTHITLSAYADNASKDRFLFYINPSENKYYTSKSHDDIDQSLVEGNGYISNYSMYGPNEDGEGRDYAYFQYKINPRYTSEYVFVGMACNWTGYGRRFYLENRQVDAVNLSQGCVALKLKKHQITLLEPEKLSQITVDDNGLTRTTQISPWGDLKLALEDGQKYGVGSKGTIYRDETATFLYSMAESTSCKLRGFKFYNNANKTKLIYEMNVAAKENQCTLTLTPELIQNLEKKAGQYQLADIYIQPVFDIQDVTVEFAGNVAEDENIEVINSINNTDGSKQYILREKDTEALIGTFRVNQASQLGDTLAVDYSPNESYAGSHFFRYYEYRIAESSNQINGAAKNTAEYSQEKLDIKATLSDTYFKIWAHTGLYATVTLQDKTVTFDNYSQEIDEAVIGYPEGRPAPTGKITYHYYTDAECVNELEEGELPVDAGIYYVTAALGQDENYGATVSAPVKLTVEQAVPTLKNLQGTAITYGESTASSTLSGTAYSLTNQVMDGTLTLVNPEGSITNAGTASEEVIFTPGEAWSKNYAAATGTAKITVKKAVPTLILTNITEIYDGESVTRVPTYVRGIYNENTGQKVNYEFYSGEECLDEQELEEPPVNAGTYYVKAYTSSNTNYGYVETEEPVELVIKKRESELIQVPLPNKEYRVYFTNVVAGEELTGTVTLEILVNGIAATSVEGLAIQKDEAGRQYASYMYDSVADLVEGAEIFTVRASYSSSANYIFNSSELRVGNNDGKYSAISWERVTMAYGTSKDMWVVDSSVIEEARQADDVLMDMDVTWLNVDTIAEKDVVSVTTTGKAYAAKISAKAENTGTATVAAFVQGYTKSGCEKQWYIFYEFVVEPAEVEIVIPEAELQKEKQYSGENVTIEGVSVFPDLPVTYTYYTDAEFKNELQDSEGNNVAPINVGTYYVKVSTEKQRNYNAGEANAIIRILPAEPKIEMTDKTVVYNGEKQTLDAAVVMGVDGYVEENEITDAGRIPAGTVVYCYCNSAECQGCDGPTEAGTYTVKAIYNPGKTDNYSQAEIPTASLVIQQAECVLQLESQEVTYSGEIIKIEVPEIVGGGEVQLRYSLSTEFNYTDEVPVDAGMYNVYAFLPESNNYKRVISNIATVLVRPSDLTIELQDTTTVYSGETKYMESLLPAAVLDNKGADISDKVTVNYQYYIDEEAMFETEAPMDAGVYYVKAVTEDYRNYNKAESGLHKMIIKKAIPELSELKATSIMAGEQLFTAELSGIATDVDGKIIDGMLVWAEAVGHKTYPAGTYEFAVEFIPNSNWTRNYEAAYANVAIEVLPDPSGSEAVKDNDSQNTSNAVDTGDDTNVLGYILCMLMAVAGLIFSTRKIRR